jgi:hypothetical protein
MTTAARAVRMNISVPGDLAKRVRDARLPVSAICQRALIAALDCEALAPSVVAAIEAAVRTAMASPDSTSLTD